MLGKGNVSQECMEFRLKLIAVRGEETVAAKKYRNAFRGEVARGLEKARKAFEDFLEVGEWWGIEKVDGDGERSPEGVVLEMMDLVGERMMKEFDLRYGVKEDA